jgi:hypothetical protein
MVRSRELRWREEIRRRVALQRRWKARVRNVVLSTLAVADASAFRDAAPDCTLTVTIGNTDLPAFVSGGRLYIQAALPHVFRAFAEDLSDFIGDMEIRISGAGGSSFSLDSDGRPIPCEAVAFEGVVRDSGEWG